MAVSGSRRDRFSEKLELPPYFPAYCIINNTYMSRPIFVSDLDGTLLQPDASLSPFAQTNLTRLLENGVPFSIATARNIVSVRQIVGDLPISLPVVCSNGAYLCNWDSDERYAIKALGPDLAISLLSYLQEHDYDPFCASFTQADDHLYMSDSCGTGTGWYRDDRSQHKDPRVRLVPDVKVAAQEHVISINVIQPASRIAILKEDLHQRFGHKIRVYTYEHWSMPEWTWLSVYHPQATKGAALAQLLKDHGYDSADLTVFGDELNDISMFQMAGHAVAMSHARAELKTYANELIGTNETDSVVNYILSATAQLPTLPK